MRVVESVMDDCPNCGHELEASGFDDVREDCVIIKCPCECWRHVEAE